MNCNNNPMKKKIFYAASFFLIVLVAPSCEKSCKFCKSVTYENGVVQNSGSETEYCGTDLIAKEATPDVTVGALTTKVECR